jgi:tetratricopeptide (TPR) repeat protein
VNLKIGLPRRAAADYDAALKVNARHASSLYGRGMARLRMGEAAEGNSDIRQALSMDPKIADEFARVGIK